MDERLNNIKHLCKDFDILEEYLENPDSIIEVAEKLGGEGTRLAMLMELIKKVANLKNGFVHSFNVFEKETKKLNSQRDEVLEQLARQRIITSDLTNQIINIKKILETYKMSEKSFDELLVKTKEYLIECSCCHSRVNGTMDEILNVSPCAKCGEKASWEIRTRILA